MQYEIPNSVMVAVSSRDTQLTFARRALMKAARKAGLPLLEQTAYAHFIYPLSTNDLLFKMRWAGKDPSLFDDSRVKDWEFSRRAIYELNDTEKEELRIRQIYYVLKGGVLGSMSETKNSDTIIVELNIVYDKNIYTLEKAQQILKPLIDDAENVYSAIEVKFYITWAAGTGNYEKFEISSGAKEGCVNVFFTYNVDKNARDSIAVTQTFFDDKGELGTKNIFLVRGFYDFLQRNLTHELGHRFGIVTYSGKKFLGYDIGNYTSDKVINTAILMMRNRLVVKGIDWKGEFDSISEPFRHLRLRGKNYGPTTLDYMRAGARQLSRKR